MGRLWRMLPWLPTVAGVVILVGLLVFALVSLSPDEPRRALPPPAGTPPFLAGPNAPTHSPPAPPATVNAPRRPSPPTPAPATPATTAPKPDRSPERTAAAPPPPDLTGRYRTVQTFEGGFIGEVLVTNSASAARTWTVRIRWPSTIGPMRTFWVEGAPQATLKQEGDVFAWTGSVAVGARSSVPLRFQFDRTTSVTTPQTCSVNGTTCT